MTNDAPNTLWNLLAGQAERRPDAMAAIASSERLTYGALAERAERIAGRLVSAGIQPGDAVALWMPNGASYLAAIFALARLSVLAVHINTRFRPREAGDILLRSRAKVLITDLRFDLVPFAEHLEAMPEAELAQLAIILSPGGREPVRGRPVLDLVAPGGSPLAARPDAPCLTYTTSGTTARPKLVLHSQQPIARHAVDAARGIGVEEDGAVLALMPFCGTYGNALVLTGIARGARIVLADRFEQGRIAGLIREHRVTHLAATDDVLGRLAAEARREPINSLVFSGFASFTPQAAANIAAAAEAGFHPRALYGSSECQALFAIAPDDDPLTPGGVPVSDETAFSIRDLETGEPVEDGRDGELCLKAPSLFVGYFENEEATRAAFTADGAFRTSDVANARGRQFRFGRRLGDTIRLGGFLVDPAEIESVLTGAGAVGAQVVAVEDGAKFVPVAFVLWPRGEAFDSAALKETCRGRLAGYKVPVLIERLDSFPVTASANGEKIQKAELRKRAAEALAGREKALP